MTEVPMRVYVATAWPNKVAATALMQRLTNAGFAVTHDWTQNEAWDWHDQDEVDHRAPYAAELDLMGVLGADAFVLLTYETPDYTPRGCLVEFGAALADPQKIIVLVGDQPTNVFRYHPRVLVVQNVEQALAYLKLRREKRAA